MKTLTRILILSATSFAALQCNLVRAQGTPKPLWAEEDALAKLSFVNPEDERDPGSPARAEFVNPETEERLAVAGSSFGDPDRNSAPVGDDHVYLACKPDSHLHPSQ